MKTSIFTCDGCGTEKKESNHWYVVASGKYFSVAPWGHMEFSTIPNSFARDDSDARHICGHECLMKQLTKFLNTAGGKEA